MKIFKFCVIILLIFNYTALKSQTITGFFFGGNLSYVTGNQDYVKNNLTLTKKIKPGFNGGVFFDIKSGYARYIEIGGFYIQKGCSYKSDVFRSIQDTISGTENYIQIRNNNFNYLQIPVMWKQQWGDWYTQLGLWAAVPIAPTMKWIEIRDTYDTIYRFKGPYSFPKEDFRAYDMGLIIGTGVQLPLNNSYDFFISVTYNHGFLTTFPNYNRKDEAQYNRTFCINTGIILNNKGYKYKNRRR